YGDRTFGAVWESVGGFWRAAHQSRRNGPQRKSLIYCLSAGRHQLTTGGRVVNFIKQIARLGDFSCLSMSINARNGATSKKHSGSRKSHWANVLPAREKSRN